MAASLPAVTCRLDMFRNPAFDKRVELPADDVMFFSTLVRARGVDTLARAGQPARSYIEAVCAWPHPTHGHFVFPISLPFAQQLEAQFPEFGEGREGLTGQWRLTAKGLGFVRRVAIPEFWALIQHAGINPPWIEPCFDAYKNVALEDVPALCSQAALDIATETQAHTQAGEHEADEESIRMPSPMPLPMTAETGARATTRATIVAMEV